jgi:hypothetical protein
MMTSGCSRHIRHCSSERFRFQDRWRVRLEASIIKARHAKGLDKSTKSAFASSSLFGTRTRELDQFATNLSIAGEKQEKVADDETAVLLKRFSCNPDVENARVEFDRAQKVEERFHRDFDGVDFTGNSLASR